MADVPNGTAPITDRRSPPRGVLPRRTQMWLMLGLAFAMLAIILLTGRPEPADQPVGTAALQPSPLTTDRLRDYQDRLRVLDARARQEPVTQPLLAGPEQRPSDNELRTAADVTDPLDTERKRREYESLFASNVVMSRRPDAQSIWAPNSTPDAGSNAPAVDGIPTMPSIDEVANAVVRASAQFAPTVPAAPQTQAPPFSVPNPPADVGVSDAQPAHTVPASTGPIESSGPLHRILEGTVIETVLTNRLDGGIAAPVNCLVTTPVYSHDRRHILIPSGSRVLGETKPVQGFGETRLAVAFDRVVLPDGRTHRLDSFMGLNDIGDAGLRDQVNHHYRSTFGASAAIGLITGFAQSLGSLGLNGGAAGRTVVIAGSVGDATAQATAQTMNRFLNRLPTITIREGHRVKVYLTSDLELPVFGIPIDHAASRAAQRR
ncbi:MAG: TrbI/VirB10 family protein [Vicinamibacterales bacterium]